MEGQGEAGGEPVGVLARQPGQQHAGRRVVLGLVAQLGRVAELVEQAFAAEAGEERLALAEDHGRRDDGPARRPQLPVEPHLEVAERRQRP